jgi:hypothetical protein
MANVAGAHGALLNGSHLDPMKAGGIGVPMPLPAFVALPTLLM